MTNIRSPINKISSQGSPEIGEFIKEKLESLEYTIAWWKLSCQYKYNNQNICLNQNKQAKHSPLWLVWSKVYLSKKKLYKKSIPIWHIMITCCFHYSQVQTPVNPFHWPNIYLREVWCPSCLCFPYILSPPKGYLCLSVS